MEVRQAAYVMSGGHEDDLKVVRDHFIDRLGSGRMAFPAGSFFAAVAMSEQDISRLKDEADTLIGNRDRDLALLTAIYRRVDGSWELVAGPLAQASDKAIETELSAYPGNIRAKPLDVPEDVSWPSLALTSAAPSWSTAYAEVVVHLSTEDAQEFAQLLWELGFRFRAMVPECMCLR